MLVFNNRALQEAREARGLSCAELGLKMQQRSRQWVNQIENGERLPTLRTFLMFLNVLGVKDVTPFFIEKGEGE